MEELNESSESLIPLLEYLRIPVEYYHLEVESASLLFWKDTAWSTLRRLNDPALLNAVPNTLRHRFVTRISSFIGSDNFTSSNISDAASILADKLVSGLKNDREVIRAILEGEIKPLFIASAHPRLNLESGRMLSRTAGGEAAAQDFFRDQKWKHDGLGCWNVLRWCIQRLEPEDFDTLWPLLVPPLMALVDDFEPAFKLQGILAATDMLDRVDTSLLKRTGLDTLLLKSLSNAMTFLSDPEAPPLFLAATRCYMLLVKRTTEPGSQKRYELLWDLISSDIIGGAWIYATRNGEMMEASVEALNPIVTELGIASVRFMKALVPQLSDFMITKPAVPTAPRLQLLSSQCLTSLIRICAPTGLVTSWKYRILDGMLRCWVETMDKRGNDVGLLQSLRDLSSELVAMCPELHQNEIPRLLESDREMFKGLFNDKRHV